MKTRKSAAYCLTLADWTDLMHRCSSIAAVRGVLATASTGLHLEDTSETSDFLTPCSKLLETVARAFKNRISARCGWEQRAAAPILRQLLEQIQKSGAKAKSSCGLQRATTAKEVSKHCSCHCMLVFQYMQYLRSIELHFPPRQHCVSCIADCERYLPQTRANGASKSAISIQPFVHSDLQYPQTHVLPSCADTLLWSHTHTANSHICLMFAMMWHMYRIQDYRELAWRWTMWSLHTDQQLSHTL
jgi:hypothetical protein